MTKKTGAIIVVVLLVIVVIVSLASCNGGSSSETHSHGIDSGVVVKSSKGKITVREDDGEYDTHRATKKCTVGKRWPDCKK